MVLIYFAAPRPPIVRIEQGFRSRLGATLCDHWGICSPRGSLRRVVVSGMVLLLKRKQSHLTSRIPYHQ